MTQPVPASIQIVTLSQNGTKISYPQVAGLDSPKAQDAINTSIRSLVNDLIKYQHSEQGANQFIEMIGTFEIKNNQRNILSLTIINYAYAALHAHGLTLMKSLTFDTQTGKQYNLKDMFKKGINYTSHLDTLVEQQAKIRDIQLFDPKINIHENQDFYLADKTLVIYFQAYEIAAYVYGLPTFVLPAYTLTPILNDEGPLSRLEASI